MPLLHPSTNPPPFLLPAPLHLLLPHSCDKESQFSCQGNRIFFHGDVGTRGKGRAALFRPVMKDSPHACLIARLMVPAPTAEPIYYRLIMLIGASDIVILPVLSCCVAPTTGTLAIVAQHSWWIQLRPQIVRSDMKDTHVSLKWFSPGQINTLNLHTQWHKTELFAFFRYAGTHPLLFGLAQQGGKMADHHGNYVCCSATAVMYVMTLLTHWWTLYCKKTVLLYMQRIGSVDFTLPDHGPLSNTCLDPIRQYPGYILYLCHRNYYILYNIKAILTFPFPQKCL